MATRTRRSAASGSAPRSDACDNQVSGIVLMLWPTPKGWRSQWLKVVHWAAQPDPDQAAREARQIGLEWVARRHQFETEGRPPRIPLALDEAQTRDWARRVTIPYQRRYQDVHLPWAKLHGIYLDAVMDSQEELVLGLTALARQIPAVLAEVVVPESLTPPDGDQSTEE